MIARAVAMGPAPSRWVCYCGVMRLALDTSESAGIIHQQAYRRLGLAGRLRIALELSDLAHAFAVAGIRRKRACSDNEARTALAERLYGSARITKQE